MKPIKSRFPPFRVILKIRKSSNQHEISQQKHVSDGINQNKKRYVTARKVIHSQPNQKRKCSVMKDVIPRHQNIFLSQHEDNRFQHVSELHDEKCIAMIYNLKRINFFFTLDTLRFGQISLNLNYFFNEQTFNSKKKQNKFL